MDRRTLYEIVGVSENATPDEIKSAYRKKAMDLHPDMEGGNEEEFKLLNNAYHTLMDDQKRKAYKNSGNRPVSNNDELNDLIAKVLIIIVAVHLFYPSKRRSSRRRNIFLKRFF